MRVKAQIDEVRLLLGLSSADVGRVALKRAEVQGKMVVRSRAVRRGNMSRRKRRRFVRSAGARGGDPELAEAIRKSIEGWGDESESSTDSDSSDKAQPSSRAAPRQWKQPRSFDDLKRLVRDSTWSSHFKRRFRASGGEIDTDGSMCSDEEDEHPSISELHAIARQ